jgi:hypothetical protein
MFFSRLFKNKGLKGNGEKLARRGIDMAEFDGLYQKAQTLDNEQESLKAKLKSKTAELEEVMSKLELRMSEAKKIVKMDIAKENWKEFGITDGIARAAKKPAAAAAK